MQQPTGSGASGLTDNMASALCYLPIIGLVFLFIAPYSTNKTVRFHAFQSIFLAIAAFILNFIVSYLAGSMYYVTGIGALLGLLSMLLSLGELALFIILAVRAYQGQTMELPFISQFARQQA